MQFSSVPPDAYKEAVAYVYHPGTKTFMAAKECVIVFLPGYINPEQEDIENAYNDSPSYDVVEGNKNER